MPPLPPSLVALALLAACALASCRRPNVESDAGESTRPVRGDSVVVEQTAAEFFEGRVLGSSGDRLRVEVHGKSGSVLVSVGDVYRLPPPAQAFKPAELAICNSARHVWVPCKVVRSNATSLSMKDAEDREFELGPSSVLSATGVTELNLQRHFTRNQARTAFAASASAAGAPRAPHGWRPGVREWVLARDGAGWFSAHIHEIREDDLLVSWDSDRQVSAVEPRALVPQPPYDAALSRGNFVLMRPLSPSRPWNPVRIRSVTGAEIVVEDIAGVESQLGVRDVVPLGIDTGVRSDSK